MPKQLAFEQGGGQGCRINRDEELRKLNEETLMRELGPFLTKSAVEAVMARRDKIVPFFDMRIGKEGEPTVICSLPEH